MPKDEESLLQSLLSGLEELWLKAEDYGLLWSMNFEHEEDCLLGLNSLTQFKAWNLWTGFPVHGAREDLPHKCL